MRSFGEFLKERRVEKGITIDALPHDFKLNQRIIKALESDNYEFFKGYFYFINFLKDYLRALDQDVDGFVSEFKEELDIVKKTNFSTGIYFPGVKYSKFRKRNIFPKLLLLLIGLLLIVGVAKIDFFREILSGNSNELLKIPSTFLDSQCNNVIENDFYPVNLSFQFLEDCWIRIFRGNKILMERVFHKTEKYSAGGYSFVLFIGNPSAVILKINEITVDKFKERPSLLKLIVNPETVNRFGK